MRSIQHLAGGVLAEIVRRQPPSAARTEFAWQVAVGPALSRATSVYLEKGVLRVHAPDARWLKEIERARPAILAKMQHLLGADNVTRIATR